MGRQLVFYLGPSDMEELEARLKKLEDPLILHSRSPEPKPRIVESTDFKENGRRWLYFYLVRPDDVSAIDFEEVPEQRYWSMDVSSSPVVELTTCYFDGKVLKRGRLYYTEGSYGDDDHWVEKPEAFKSWAKQLLSAARKTLKLDRDVSAYVGPEAVALKAKGVEFTAL
jgi:hypothetical protein